MEHTRAWRLEALQDVQQGAFHNRIQRRRIKLASRGLCRVPEIWVYSTRSELVGPFAWLPALRLCPPRTPKNTTAWATRINAHHRRPLAQARRSTVCSNSPSAGGLSKFRKRKPLEQFVAGTCVVCTYVCMYVLRYSRYCNAYICT
jgi:hypothetical protein